MRFTVKEVIADDVTVNEIVLPYGAIEEAAKVFGSDRLEAILIGHVVEVHGASVCGMPDGFRAAWNAQEVDEDVWLFARSGDRVFSLSDIMGYTWNCPSSDSLAARGLDASATCTGAPCDNDECFGEPDASRVRTDPATGSVNYATFERLVTHSLLETSMLRGFLTDSENRKRARPPADYLWFGDGDGIRCNPDGMVDDSQRVSVYTCNWGPVVDWIARTTYAGHWMNGEY